MLNQSITVINKSGKVVSTSKHLVSVWKEARAAYKSRKAEIKANREAEQARLALQDVSLSEEHLPRSQHHHPHHSKSTTGKRGDHRPPLDRGHTDSTHLNNTVYAHPSDPAFEPPNRGLKRRSTEPPRPASAESYDEHLAYGELPPPLPLRPADTETQLRGKMFKLNHLLDEANCLQYSATAMIEHLQKNPDALAAVALTLAEISAMVTKVAPSALLSLKTAFPAVVALLASPEFLIAGGVAVGVTVVMLGGYKVIKKITSPKAREGESEVGQLREIEGDLSNIEVWRRGVADASDAGTATSVEGEFVTPGAERRLVEEGVLAPSHRKPLRRAKSERTHKRRDDTQSVYSEDTRRSRHSRKHHSGTSKHGDDQSKRSASSSRAVKSGKKSVGGLRMLFGRRRSHPVT